MWRHNHSATRPKVDKICLQVTIYPSLLCVDADLDVQRTSGGVASTRMSSIMSGPYTQAGFNNSSALNSGVVLGLALSELRVSYDAMVTSTYLNIQDCKLASSHLSRPNSITADRRV